MYAIMWSGSGKGFWKFNNSLLTDKDYVDKNYKISENMCYKI